MSNIRDKVRQLRRDSTPSERLLWEYLRHRKFLNLKFKRQYPISYITGKDSKNNYFIADFYYYEKKLVVELDGEIHDDQKDYDIFRDETLSDMGIMVLRIKNKELQDINKVLNKIEHACQSNSIYNKRNC